MGKVIGFFLLLWTVILLSGSVPAFAVCMSCISRTGQSYTELACEGDSKYDVVRKCGDPDFSEETQQVTSGDFGKVRRDGNTQGFFGSTTTKVETLYYNCGQGRFIRVLIFFGGRLSSIQQGDRGSGDQKCW
jgi:hypothetical protein